MRKNILITGIHGYIGNALKDKLTRTSSGSN